MVMTGKCSQSGSSGGGGYVKKSSVYDFSPEDECVEKESHRLLSKCLPPKITRGAEAEHLEEIEEDIDDEMKELFEIEEEDIVSDDESVCGIDPLGSEFSPVQHESGTSSEVSSSKMTSNMAYSRKKVDYSVDRISNLPDKVIECIMNFMPTRDAARTCVLSTRWRYVWADHPSLVLDECFLDVIKRNTSTTDFVIDYPIIVSRILLNHVGYVRRFVLYVSLALSSMPHINIDSWLSSLCRRGLEVLTLNNLSMYHYKVPRSVFSSPYLFKLDLSYCIIESGCFTKIQFLYLSNVTFDSSVVLTAPLLTSLHLWRCRGIRCFDISAPKLERLFLFDNDDLNLKPFLACAGIDYAFLHSRHKTDMYIEGRKSVCLVNLLAAWPRIHELVVYGVCFKYLATGHIPCILDHHLDLRSFSFRFLKWDSELIPSILCILKNSPLLHTFDISFDGGELNGGMTDNIDESRSVVDFQMNQLHTVILKGFTATPNEVVLATILLQRAPVLDKMIVEENCKLDDKEQVRVLKKLLSLQQINPKAKIVFWSN